MEGSEFQRALDASEELIITVTGRKSGREHSTPVWFVLDGKTVFLLPVKGSNSEWFKNLVESKRIKISTGNASLELTAKPLTQATTVGPVVEKFRKKHGEGDVKKYYTGLDAAVQLTLP